MPTLRQSKLVLEVVALSVDCWVDRVSPAVFPLPIGGCFVTTVGCAVRPSPATFSLTIGGVVVGVVFRTTTEPPEWSVGIAAAETGNATPTTAATNSAV